MRRRRATLMFIGGTILLALLGGAMPKLIEESPAIDITFPWQQTTVSDEPAVAGSALEALNGLEVKGRAPKTDYARAQFGSGWATVNGCSTSDVIMFRDLINVTLSDECTVASGLLNDTYTGEAIQYTKDDPSAIQIDHVIALSDAWQTGAQNLTRELRIQLANDPLELIAVQGDANQQKSDGNAASWLPSNKAFRCQYIARQIAVKQKYTLWLIPGEKQAMLDVLSTCPDQTLPAK